MNSFRGLAYPLFGILVGALPLLVLAASLLTTLSIVRSAPDARRAGIRFALITLAFILLDGLMLKGLGWLGLSFGPLMFSFVFLVGFRLTLFVLGSVVLVRCERWAARFPLPLVLVHALVTAAAVYGFYIEPFRLAVSYVEIPVSAGQLSERVRVVQISDLHVERLTRRERALVPLVQGLNPDLIVLTGDYLNLSYLNDELAAEHARWVFGGLSAPYGIYAIDGSVDSDFLMTRLFSGLPVQVITAKSAQVNLPAGSIYLLGVPDWDLEQSAEVLKTLAGSAPPGAYRLALRHTPDLIYTAAEAHVDLYLAGHTHGGQIRLPLYGAIVTASMFGKRFESGLYQVGDTSLYVSRGLGMEGGFAPRVRFLASPEVVVIDLVPVEDP